MVGMTETAIIEMFIGPREDSSLLPAALTTWRTSLDAPLGAADYYTPLGVGGGTPHTQLPFGETLQFKLV